MIVNRLGELCEELGITQTQLCDRAGLFRSVIARYYRNETTNVNFDTLDAICSSLNSLTNGSVTLQDFIYYVRDDKASLKEFTNVRKRNEKAERISKLRSKNKKETPTNE